MSSLNGAEEPAESEYDGPRAVTDPDGMTDDTQMTLLGIVVAAGSGLVMLPVVPLLLIAELIERLGGDGTD